MSDVFSISSLEKISLTSFLCFSSSFFYFRNTHMYVIKDMFVPPCNHHHHHHHHHHLVSSAPSSWTIMDLHCFLLYAFFTHSAYPSSVHSLMLSIHIVLGLPLTRFPLCFPSSNNLCIPSFHIICPKYAIQ